jgi:hypothetical protein
VPPGAAGGLNVVVPGPIVSAGLKIWSVPVMCDMPLRYLRLGTICSTSMDTPEDSSPLAV